MGSLLARVLAAVWKGVPREGVALGRGASRPSPAMARWRRPLLERFQGWSSGSRPGAGRSQAREQALADGSRRPAVFCFFVF